MLKYLINKYTYFLIFTSILLPQNAFTSSWDSFSQVKVAEEYSEVLSRGELVLEIGGGKLIEMSDGSLWVIGIGSTAVKTPLNGTEILRQRKVAEQKARKAVVEELQVTQVESLTKAFSKSTISVENGKENSRSVEELEETIQSRVAGIIQGLKQAGTWYSQDGQIFYLALCNRLK